MGAHYFFERVSVIVKLKVRFSAVRYVDLWGDQIELLQTRQCELSLITTRHETS